MAQLIKGETGNWEMVIGMEVHAQVIANSKLFQAHRQLSGRSKTVRLVWLMPLCRECYPS